MEKQREYILFLVFMGVVKLRMNKSKNAETATQAGIISMAKELTRSVFPKIIVS